MGMSRAKTCGPTMMTPTKKKSREEKALLTDNANTDRRLQAHVAAVVAEEAEEHPGTLCGGGAGVTQTVARVGDVVALRLCGRLKGNRGQLVTQVLQPLLGDLARNKV